MGQVKRKTGKADASARGGKQGGKILKRDAGKGLRILMLEDNPADSELVESELQNAGILFSALRVETRSDFLKALKTFSPDVILADFSLPQFDALLALALRNKMAPQIPFIVVTGSVSEETAVECMKQGADDYLLKDRLARLGEAIRLALSNRRLLADKIAVEESLRASESMYRTFIDSSTDMAFLKDDRFRHLLANQALCRFYGKEEIEIIGRTDAELMDKRAAAKCRKTDKEALAEKRLHFSEEKIGSRTFETRKFPVKLTNGRIGVGGYIRDISERKLAEQALHESEDRYRDLVENSQELIFTHDLEGKLLSVNKIAAQLTGYPVKDLLGMNLTALLVPEVRHLFAAYLTEIKTKGMARGRMRVRTASGENRYWEYSNTLRTKDVTVPIVRGLAHDITERERAEKLIQASLTEKEVLLKEIHHRVKNNLQVISGLLTLQAAQTNDEKLQRMVKESQGRIWTMALIHQTLYQSGNLVDIDMADYIRSLAGNLLSSHAKAAMPPAIDFDLMPLRLAIDKAIPLGLIINELMTNAMKHAFPDGRSGEIRIALQECRGTTDGAPCYELTVADNGAGLPAGFDATKYKSLGLQLVTMLSKQLGGSMAIESSDGTSVHVVFTVNEKKAKLS